jgi:hypothetical protein
MQCDPRFHARTSRLQWAIVLLIAVMALPGAGLTFTSSKSNGSELQQSEDEPIAGGPHREDQQDQTDFIVLPIKTELQRKLLGGDRTLVAFVEINGRVFLDKDPDEIVRAIDTVALRKALVRCKDESKQSRVHFNITFFGPLEPGLVESAQKNLFKPLQQVCEAVAGDAGLKAAKVTESFNGDPQFWKEALAAVEAIVPKKDEMDEAGVGDGVIMAYPVRSHVSRWIAGADCVAYIFKPLDGADPLIGAEIRERLSTAISKLNLPAKDKIRFFFVIRPKGDDEQARQVNYEDITRGIVGDGGAAQELAEFLGFKTSSSSF